MKRDEWDRAEPMLTKVVGLPADEQKRVIESAFLDDAVRRELFEVLRRTNVVVSRTVGSDAAAYASDAFGSAGAAAFAVQAPLFVANDTLADGRFRIVRQLGRGGMGEVYLASDLKLEALVALKVLLEPQTREAQHARRCSGHPHIATMHDVIETTVGDRTVTVLVMEHVAGRPASRIIDDGPVAIAEAVQWARQVASALARAHDCDVLHCDLKPANILITPEGAKVVDFGIGRARFEPSQRSAPIRGTLPYMPPEQLGDGRFSPAGDIYGLGVTLFELLTGRLPFEGDGAELILRIIAEPAPRLGDFRKGVPAELEELVSRALAKSPADRHRSARAFEHALEAVDLHAGAGARPDVPPDGRQRLLYAVGGLAIAFLLVTFAGYVTSMLFNSPLQRTQGFSGESAWDWPGWGFRVLVPAAIATALAVGSFTVLKGLCTIVLSAPGVRSVWRPVQHAVRDRIARAAPAAQAKFLLGAQATFLLWFGWYFQDIFEGLDSFISQRPPVDLSALSPDNQPRQMWFDLVLCLHLWVFGIAWFRTLRREMAARSTGDPRIAAAGLALTVVAFYVGEAIPFRIIYHNESERAMYRSQLCYIVGQRGQEVLLFCPLQPPPWSRVVKLDDAALQRDGTVENIFKQVQSPTRPGGI